MQHSLKNLIGLLKPTTYYASEMVIMNCRNQVCHRSSFLDRQCQRTAPRLGAGNTKTKISATDEENRQFVFLAQHVGCYCYSTGLSATKADLEIILKSYNATHIIKYRCARDSIDSRNLFNNAESVARPLTSDVAREHASHSATVSVSINSKLSMKKTFLHPMCNVTIRRSEWRLYGEYGFDWKFMQITFQFQLKLSTTEWRL